MTCRYPLKIMSGLEHIYRNADKGDSLNVVLDNKSICKMIKKIKQQGYSVTVSEDYSNMENYKRFSSFLAKAQKKKVVAFAGCFGKGIEQCMESGLFDACYSITDGLSEEERGRAMQTECAMQNMERAVEEKL